MNCYKVDLEGNILGSGECPQEIEANIKKLAKQFAKLIENPTMYHKFTKDLYEYMYIRGEFIAHYNREGFFKARFWSLNDFDTTLDIMRRNRELALLLDHVSTDALAMARYKIAAMEANVLTQQARSLEDHVNRLQEQFQLKLIG